MLIYHVDFSTLTLLDLKSWVSILKTFHSGSMLVESLLLDQESLTKKISHLASMYYLFGYIPWSLGLCVTNSLVYFQVIVYLSAISDPDYTPKAHQRLLPQTWRELRKISLCRTLVRKRSSSVNYLSQNYSNYIVPKYSLNSCLLLE